MISLTHGEFQKNHCIYRGNHIYIYSTAERGCEEVIKLFCTKLFPVEKLWKRYMYLLIPYRIHKKYFL